MTMALQSTQFKPARTTNRAKPPGLMAPLMKLPLVLYRLRLGWLFGHWFMRLTHVGRKSGKLRHTVLLVLRHDPRSGEVMVVSAWNASEWYRNIHAAPALQVDTGRECFVPEQRDLSAEEIAVSVDEFRKRHPFVARIFCRIPGWSYPDSEEKLRELAAGLRGVAFRPKRI
jgi:deazaflavin-dependent oxidoreductase (nitroreductase family)